MLRLSDLFSLLIRFAALIVCSVIVIVIVVFWGREEEQFRARRSYKHLLIMQLALIATVHNYLSLLL